MNNGTNCNCKGEEGTKGTAGLETGQRYLLNKISTRVVLHPMLNPEEHFILEISDSGKFFKSRDIDNKINWFSISKFEVIEKLSKNGI
jgi:hypothetical protein